MQLLAVYTNPESHNAQRHRQTDGQTDGQQDDANSRSYCVAVRSAKNMANTFLIRIAEKMFISKSEKELQSAALTADFVGLLVASLFYLSL